MGPGSRAPGARAASTGALGPGWRTSRSGWTTGTGAPETLRGLYEQYCRVERAELLGLIPREGLRALWRRERESAGLSTDGAPATERLREAASRLLPLPPYDVWLGSYLDDRTPYLERIGVPATPSRPDPVTVSTRPVSDDLWVHLEVTHRESGWVGVLSFHGPRAGRGIRSAEVFRAGDPAEFRERFEEFTVPTLEAFWRSVAG